MIEISGKVIGVIDEEQGTLFLVQNDVGGYEKLYDIYRNHRDIIEGTAGTFQIEACENWNDRARNWEAVLCITNFEEY